MSSDHPRGGVRKRISPQAVSPSIDSLICATEGLALSGASQPSYQSGFEAAPTQPRTLRAVSSPHTIVRQHGRSVVLNSRSQPASQPSSGSSLACSPTTPSASAQRRLHALRRRMTTASGPQTSSTTARTRSASHVQHRRTERRGRFRVVYDRDVSPGTLYQESPTAAHEVSSPFTRHSAPQAGCGETVRGGGATGIGIGLGPSRATSEPPQELSASRVRYQGPNVDLAFGDMDDIEDMDIGAAPQPTNEPASSSPSRRNRHEESRRQPNSAGVGLEPGYLGDQDSRRRGAREGPGIESASDMETGPSTAMDSSCPPKKETPLPRVPRGPARLQGRGGAVGKGCPPSDGSDPRKQMQNARNKQ